MREWRLWQPSRIFVGVALLSSHEKVLADVGNAPS